MSTESLKRMAMILGALILVWAILALWRRTARDDVTRLTLARVDTALVDTITIRHASDTVRLARTPRGWTVNGFAAALDQVREFLGALGDTGAHAELVAENAASQSTFGVDSVAAHWLTVKAGSRALATYALGHRDASYDGVYLRLPGQAPTFDLHARLGDYTEKGVNDWRDKRIVSIATDSVQGIAVQRGRVAYELVKQGSSWSLAKGAADSTAVASLLGTVKELNATGFASAAQADSVNFKAPDRRLRLSGAAGKPLLDLVFDSTASGFWVRRDSLGTIFQIDSYTANQLTPADSTIKPKKKT